MPRTGLTAPQIREKAIESTVAKMREVGFAKVRLTEIARDIGVSHAALYMHFRDKGDLLDAVSRTWLERLDERLAEICVAPKPAVDRIRDWMLTIHATKVEKVRVDPALYLAFEDASEVRKPFVADHLKAMHDQLTGLVREAAEEARGMTLDDFDAEGNAKVLSAAMLGFHHPRMVAQYNGENREELLLKVLDSVLVGLKLKD